MKIRLLVTATMLAAATSVGAQGKTTADQQCRTGTVAAANLQDACQKAIDLFTYMAPQLGTAMAGGNATLGQPSSLGGLGHFSLGVRATAVKGSIPDFDKSAGPSSGAAVSTAYETKEVPVPFPGVDLAIGLFKGIPLGITNLGGVDLLLSAAYVPEGEVEKISLKTPEGSLKIGFGARLGILQEGSVSPGVSVTYMQRGLPAMDLTYVRAGIVPAEDDSVYLRDLDISTSSLRIVASKKLLFIGLAVGYGMDSYKLSSNVSAVVNEACIAPGGFCRFAPANNADGEPGTLASFDSDVSRSNLFANLSLNLGPLKLVGEVGQVSGGDIKTFNTYKDKPDMSRQYASAGFRIGF